MPTNIGDIASWAAVTKLKRSDKLATAVDAAVAAYLLICAKVPFGALQAKSSEIPMVVGEPTYSFSSLSPELNGIMSIRITYGTGQHRRLRRSHVRVYDSLGSVSNGRPATYARFGTGIEVNPPPDSSSYTMRVRYWTRPTILTDKELTQLLWPTEWDELGRYETLWRLYTDLEMPDKAAMLATPMPMPRQVSPKKTRQFEAAILPRLWNDLLNTIEERENVDEDFSINPVVRGYTHSR